MTSNFPINQNPLLNNGVYAQNSNNNYFQTNNYAATASVFDSYEQTSNKSTELTILENDFKEVQANQGFIGKIWNGVKNVTGIGLSSKDVEAKIQQYKNGEITYEEAMQSIDSYEQKQKDGVNILTNAVAGVATGLIAIGTGGIGLGVIGAGAAIGAGSKVALKTMDRATNDVEGDAIDLKQMAKDTMTGAVDGAVNVATGGMIGKVGSTLTQTIVNGAIQGAKAGAISGAAGGAAEYTADVITGDREFSASEFAATTISSAAMGGAFGGVVGGITGGIRHKGSTTPDAPDATNTTDAPKTPDLSDTTDAQQKFGADNNSAVEQKVSEVSKKTETFDNGATIPDAEKPAVALRQDDAPNEVLKTSKPKDIDTISQAGEVNKNQVTEQSVDVNNTVDLDSNVQQTCATNIEEKMVQGELKQDEELKKLYKSALNSDNLQELQDIEGKIREQTILSDDEKWLASAAKERNNELKKMLFELQAKIESITKQKAMQKNFDVVADKIQLESDSTLMNAATKENFHVKIKKGVTNFDAGYSISVEDANNIYGLAVVTLPEKSAFLANLPDGYNDTAVELKFLAGSDKTKGAGTELIKQVVKDSCDLGYNGRVKLTACGGSLPSLFNAIAGAEKMKTSPVPFYYRCGFRFVDEGMNELTEQGLINLSKGLEYSGPSSGNMFLPDDAIQKILNS